MPLQFPLPPNVQDPALANWLNIVHSLLVRYVKPVQEVPHNALDGLQGGASGEYYHLTLAQLANVVALASAAYVTVPISVANGGTGTTTANGAQDALVVPLFTLEFNSSTATTVGNRLTGYFNHSTAVGFPVTPSTKRFIGVAVQASIQTGTTNGDYTVDVILRNNTDGSDVVLLTLTGTVAGGAAVTLSGHAQGSIASPLGASNIPASKQFSVGWYFRTGPGGSALSASQKSVTVVGMYI